MVHGIPVYGRGPMGHALDIWGHRITKRRRRLEWIDSITWHAMSKADQAREFAVHQAAVEARNAEGVDGAGTAAGSGGLTSTLAVVLPGPDHVDDDFP